MTKFIAPMKNAKSTRNASDRALELESSKALNKSKKAAIRAQRAAKRFDFTAEDTQA